MARKKERLPDPKITIDVHEKDNRISKLLPEMIDVDFKEGPGYDPTGDYIITDRAGNQWGIERKAFLDCVNSIRSRRVYGQVAQLKEKFGDRAILMIEDPGYIPKRLARTPEVARAIKESVLTFANEQSTMVIVWRVSTPQHAAKMLVKWAKTAHKFEIAGRGIRVIKDVGQDS